jgi:dynein light chain 1, axonemal
VPLPRSAARCVMLTRCCRCRRSNNNVSDWKEFERLKELPNLKDLLMVNNPLYNSIASDADDSEWRMNVLKRLPTLKKLDGKDVTDDELEQAMAG